MAVKISMLLFWVVMQCELIGRQKRSGGPAVSIFRAEDPSEKQYHLIKKDFYPEIGYLGSSILG